MNIGITCYPTYGGSGVVASELGIELAGRGHNVHFISYGLPFRLSRFYKNIFFHEVEIMDYPLFKYPPYSLSLSAKMAEVIESHDLDILHVHYAMPHAASAYLAREIVGNGRIKIITTLHGTDITLVGNHQCFFRITKFSIEKSDGITCVSNYLKNATKKIFGIEKDMEVIYNFVNTKLYKGLTGREKYSGLFKKADRVITHISNFRPVKNIESIVSVFHNISREVSCKLLLVGDGPEICRIRSIVDKLGLEGKVIFLGRQDDIIPLLGLSDLYMLPSRSESFGLSALEAMSCRVPVIGTNIGGLGEIVEHGKNGFLFDPCDINSMSNAAIKILSDDSYRLELGDEARKRAMQFDSSRIIPAYLDYYKKVLETA